MEFTYELVNNILAVRHPELSSNWSFLGWDDCGPDGRATATYDLEDGSRHEVHVFKDGRVEVDDAVIEEMNKISAR